MNPIDWKECVALSERWLLRSRFEWPPEHAGGFNCSSEITVSEVWGAISWVWTLPGDWLLRRAFINTFFELDPNVAGHWFSTLLGWILFFHVFWYLFVGFMFFVRGTDRK